MQPRFSLSILAAAAAAGAVSAQSDYVGPANLLFVMDNTVGLNSTSTNEATIVGDDGVLTYSPGGASPFALALADYGSWNAVFGDEDADGSYSDSVVGSVDAVWVPPGSPSPATLFDCFISLSSDLGAAGILTGIVEDGDMFRLTPTGVEVYISQQQIAVAMNELSTANLDTVAFAVDRANNDLYLSFTAPVSVSGTTLNDGGVMRIPGSALTFTGGLVTAVTPGSAEIVLTEPEVNAMSLNAGYDGITDVVGLEIDPTGGTFVTAGGQTIPHLWMCDDDSSDEGFFSTKPDASGAQGVIPSINGVPMVGNAAFGLAPGDPFGGTLDNPFAIGFQAAAPGQFAPMHIDSFPAGVSASSAPLTINVDGSGATANGLVYYVGEFFDGSVVGSAPMRSGVFPIPVSPASWGAFYPMIPSSGIVALVMADAEGFYGFPVSVPAGVPVDTAVVWQAGDLARLTISAPFMTEIN